MLILFPPGIGKYMAADLGNQEQVLSMFANFTWSDKLTAEQAAVMGASLGRLAGELMHYFCPLGVAYGGHIQKILPDGRVARPPRRRADALLLSAGRRMGASLGRLAGELMHYFCPLGVAYGGHIQKILPDGRVARPPRRRADALLLSAGRRMGASLGRLAGELMHYFCPLGVAYGGHIQKILPGMYDICVEDFMVRDVKYIWNKMTFQQLKDILKENKSVVHGAAWLYTPLGACEGHRTTGRPREETASRGAVASRGRAQAGTHSPTVTVRGTHFPLVDSPSSMVLLGSIHRWELVKVIEQQVGRERRLQVAALWHREAEHRRERTRRPSRFESCICVTAPGQLFRPKSILKKTNSFTLTRGLASPGVGGPYTPSTPTPTVYTTVTGAETRIRAAFEAIFKRSTLLQDVEGALPDEHAGAGLPRSPSINKKVQLPRERVCDMSPEDQKAWETLEMAKEIDFDRMLTIARKWELVRTDS
ncbi:Chloride channel protein 2 [Operophtera brumata]|uniref:Chloride channel protein 2 n=1 Tax=Operophtera brumata TaxID=104452 RepID=A0A0L7LJT0_OPEBR|nr:Chloride channel protein 2 [Operophtera brumata]